MRRITKYMVGGDYSIEYDAQDKTIDICEESDDFHMYFDLDSAADLIEVLTEIIKEHKKPKKEKK